MANGNKEAFSIQFWGMNGEFSYLVLESLLEAGLDIQAVVIPASITVGRQEPMMRIEPSPSYSQLPIGQPYLQRTLVHLAWRNEVPVYEIRDLRSPLTSHHLSRLETGVALVACFPWRIPESILALPHHGFLNLHPSLLPQLRGPYPLFWAFRLGLRQTGVTIHQMDPRFDTGPIALQQPISFPDGISAGEADRMMAGVGSSLLVEAVERLAAGQLQLAPQGSGGSSYSRPTAADFTIPTTWTARRAFNFIRGTAVWNHPFHIQGPDIRLSVRDAISYKPDARQDQDLLQDGRDYFIQFSPGVLHAR